MWDVVSDRFCPLRLQCTREPERRRITRWVDEHLLEAMQERVAAHPEKLRQRKKMVEHPFGTLKHWWGHSHFLMRGLKKVRGEFSLTALVYNLRRVLNIVGVKKLLEVLKSRKKRRDMTMEKAIRAFLLWIQHVVRSFFLKYAESRRQPLYTLPFSHSLTICCVAILFLPCVRAATKYFDPGVAVCHNYTNL